MKHFLAMAALTALIALPARAQAPVRGLVVKTKTPVVMDGKLNEWGPSFATPVNFGHADWSERAAVWRYMWDDQALYIGLEWLDTALFNKDPGPAFNGDGVEFYLDLREGEMLGHKDWTPGSLHLHLTAASNDQLKPRVQIRGGIPAFAGVTPQGMDLVGAKTDLGYSLELRIPWSKFPQFKPAANKEIGLDAELCSSDGGARVDRCWVYSGVAAVATPSAFARVRLVDSWDPSEGAAYSDPLFPYFLARGTPQGEQATLFVGVSPDVQPLVKRVEVTASGRKLTFTQLKKFGPGWARVQTCLVGFVGPTDASIEVKLLGDSGKVLGTRTIPLK